ncbi:MAG: proteasome assembly chaperone family protein [Halobacteriota archaeon]
MDEFDIDQPADPELEEPVLIEGLPGVGHVGKLAVEHLLEEFDAELVRRIHSEHFPPQVTIAEGRTRLACAEVYAIRDAERDLLVLTGDHQAGDGPGHYRLTETILDVAGAFDVERLYALGGVPTGELVDEPSVVGAATTDGLIEDLESVGVEFRENEPAGGIVGVSGLLLGLGERRGFEAACLMGETSGYLVDPKSARVVLEVLESAIPFEIGYDSLSERAEEMEEVVKRIRQMEQGSTPSDEDLRYIG